MSKNLVFLPSLSNWLTYFSSNFLRFSFLYRCFYGISCNLPSFVADIYFKNWRWIASVVQWNCIKRQYFWPPKETREQRQLIEWEKILASFSSTIVLITRIFKPSKDEIIFFIYPINKWINKMNRQLWKEASMLEITCGKKKARSKSFSITEWTTAPIKLTAHPSRSSCHQEYKKQ